MNNNSENYELIDKFTITTATKRILDEFVIVNFINSIPIQGGRVYSRNMDGEIII